MEANKVPFSYCHRWLTCSLKVGERHYTLFLVCGLLVYITTAVLGAIPFVGSVASLLLTFIYSVAGMRMTQQILKQGTGTVDDFLKYAFDPAFFKSFQVHLLLLAGLGLLSFTTVFIKVTSLIFASSAAIYLFTYLFSFSAFLMLQNPGLQLQAALEKVFQGFVLNIGAWLVAVLLLGLFGAVSLLLCFVPFFLYFVPMTFSVGYLIYASVFENLDVEALITEWSSKPPIHTHVLPPEA